MQSDSVKKKNEQFLKYLLEVSGKKVSVNSDDKPVAKKRQKKTEGVKPEPAITQNENDSVIIVDKRRKKNN